MDRYAAEWHNQFIITHPCFDDKMSPASGGIRPASESSSSCPPHARDLDPLPDGSIVYWEHFGMMDKKDYQEKNYRKLQNYLANGIYPPHNLIVTFDGENMLIISLCFSISSHIWNILTATPGLSGITGTNLPPKDRESPSPPLLWAFVFRHMMSNAQSNGKLFANQFSCSLFWFASCHKCRTAR